MLRVNMYQVEEVEPQTFACNLICREEPRPSTMLPPSAIAAVATTLFPSGQGNDSSGGGGKDVGLILDLEQPKKIPAVEKLTPGQREEYFDAKRRHAAVTTAIARYKLGDSTLAHDFLEFLRTKILLIDFDDDDFDVLNGAANNRLVALRRRKLFETRVLQPLKDLGWHKGQRDKFKVPILESDLLARLDNQFCDKTFTERDLYGFFGLKWSQSSQDKAQFGPDARTAVKDIQTWYDNPDNEQMQTRYMGMSSKDLGDLVKSAKEKAGKKGKKGDRSSGRDGKGKRRDREDEKEKRRGREDEKEKRHGREDKEKRHGRDGDNGKRRGRDEKQKTRGRTTERSPDYHRPVVLPMAVVTLAVQVVLLLVVVVALAVKVALDLTTALPSGSTTLAAKVQGHQDQDLQNIVYLGHGPQAQGRKYADDYKASGAARSIVDSDTLDD
ncbi:hypothetical protein BDZ89DRAFT_1044346 [Hymenopellis radicata]|nr:hypothetical protein BDZ89DRAFT_1044346 [Hymenopellis radicata]